MEKSHTYGRVVVYPPKLNLFFIQNFKIIQYNDLIWCLGVLNSPELPLKGWSSYLLTNGSEQREGGHLWVPLETQGSQLRLLKAARAPLPSEGVLHTWPSSQEGWGPASAVCTWLGDLRAAVWICFLCPRCISSPYVSARKRWSLYTWEEPLVYWNPDF